MSTQLFKRLVRSPEEAQAAVNQIITERQHPGDDGQRFSPEAAAKFHLAEALVAIQSAGVCGPSARLFQLALKRAASELRTAKDELHRCAPAEEVVEHYGL
jgi:hypothetical protein